MINLKKTPVLIAFVLIACLAGAAQAEFVWTDLAGDHLWSNPANWNAGVVPDTSTWVKVDLSPGAIVTTDTICGNLHIGRHDGPGSVTVNGATLVVDNWLTLSRGGESSLTLNSGAIMGPGDDGENLLFVIGHETGFSATFNMNGGLVKATRGGGFQIGNNAGSIGHVNLDGGVVQCNTLTLDSDAASATMNITGGTVIIDGDEVADVQEYIDNGLISAYNGLGVLQLDYDISNAGKTTLKATSPLNPDPPNNSTVASGPVELSWTLPDPCTPGEPVPVDVYFTDDKSKLEEFTDPEAIRIVSQEAINSVVVQTEPDTWYYWAVDTYVGSPEDPVWGPTFSFYAAGNLAPDVNAGGDIVTWLIEGSRTVDIDAMVIDDNAHTLQWTVVSEPNEPNIADAVIADPTIEDASVTVSALGEYVLQLEASDGEHTTSDTVTINVYDNSCEAAQSMDDYIPMAGDLNEDCLVDFVDVAILAEDWLVDVALTDTAVLPREVQ